MENEKQNVRQVSSIIENDFKLADSSSLIPAADSENLEEFRIYLTSKLAELLDNKYDTLINILYRIDVNEEKLSRLFADKNREFIPAALADLIIERQLQKIYFRKKYKKDKL